MYRLAKRLVDLFISTLIILILSPFLIPLILLLLLTGEGEVFYLQRRIGYKNSQFSIYKFATMLKNSPSMLTGSITLRDDPRVTPVGKYLRKSKVNELPQLINVIKGEMSLVGPRPQMEVDFQSFPQEVQEKIYDVKPGITGVGSIVFRDEEKLVSNSGKSVREFYTESIAPYKGDLEVWYRENANFWVDLVLIFVTGWVVFFPDSQILFKLFPGLPPKPEFLTDT